ncbi:unnamed protein product [Knipowitschia caucasica]|uniref:C3H1-type domain-containing protein n=1 Tax=Knipowitschia caucasica TaxID=637954 RepID=A0AAV2M8J8_KNICA
MTNHGDDCYFFYYSNCTKGDSCPFRHCEAAIGNEVVCNLWEEGRCFRPTCKFRHMKITHNRKQIACYWENQPAGCQKPHCAFFHEKPRCIDGLYVPPDKGTKCEEVPQEEPVPPQPPLPTAANPQVRGVKKTESQEPVPSPTHPPVVINPADDDEDEDDQFSEEGESPRKQATGPKSEESMNFGVSTLEEIRLRRAIKASMKRAIYAGGEAPNNGGKENIQSSLKHMSDAADFGCGDGVPLRRSLAERLGRIMDVEHSTVASQKSSKSVKQRLTLPSDLTATAPSVEIIIKTPEHIRIKTLEEIKLEKAAKSQNPKEPSGADISFTKTIPTKGSKSVKRAITVEDESIESVRTFSEMLHMKKKKQEENQKHKNQSEKRKDQSQDKEVAPAKNSSGEIRVKTLEEIRREKAARFQSQELTQEGPPEEAQATNSQESSAKKPRLLRLKKPALQTDKDISEKSESITETPEKPVKSTPTPTETSINTVKVKTFEEIMREKRLRKQDTEKPAASSSQSSADVDQPPALPTTSPVKRKASAKITFTPDSTTTTESGPPPAKTSPASVTSAPGKSLRAVKDTSQTVTPERRPQDTRTDAKVRPKLNVKPSVHLKPGQKRKAPQRSAVAAVKPLNSDPKSETTRLEPQVFSSVTPKSVPSPEFVCNPISTSESQAPQPRSPDTSAATQCRTPKTSSQAKPRRTSVTVSRSGTNSAAPTSAEDDFDELISEFTTDDPLEDGVDPDLGEDDLLQELSDMIDS